MEQPLADAAATPLAAEGEAPAPPPPVVATKSEPVHLVSEYEPTPAVGGEEDEDSKADVAQQIQDLQAAQHSEQDASHTQQQVIDDIWNNRIFNEAKYVTNPDDVLMEVHVLKISVLIFKQLNHSP